VSKTKITTHPDRCVCSDPLIINAGIKLLSR
jgi:hypothetical protein